VAVLQDPPWAVGEKISALNVLGRYDLLGIRTLMEASTERGPVAVTLLELSRHSDAELASKARALLARYDIEAEIARRLASDSGPATATARQIFSAMDPAQAKRVVVKLPAEARDRVAAVVPPANGQPLPTGSREGDRYYIKAQWEPKQRAVVDCLTTFFNHELVSKRTLTQEAALMRGRKERLIYGYSAQWARSAATEITKCGGRTSFVVPWKLARTGS
jgi:hypothetical protein